MIPRSRLMAVGCLVSAGLLHGLGFYEFVSSPRAAIQGGAPEQVAAIGTSFADMVAGRPTPVKSEEIDRNPDLPVTPPIEPEHKPVTDPVEAAEVPPRAVSGLETVKAVSPEQVVTDAVQPPDVTTIAARALPTETARPAETATPELATPTMSAPVGGVAVLPAEKRPEEVVERVEAVSPNERGPTEPELAPNVPVLTEPVDPTPETPSAALQMAAIAPSDPVQPPVKEELAPVDEATDLRTSPRPRARPDRPRQTDDVKTPAKPKPAPRAQQAQKEPKAPQPNQTGNADQNAQRGAETGSQSAKSTQSSSKAASSTAAGNAAVSNYQGRVFRKISRARRPSSGAKGSVRVRLTIAPSGRLSSVGVAKSSGSPDLDRLAVTQVKRAAPFPRTPTGAPVSFVVVIKRTE